MKRTFGFRAAIAMVVAGVALAACDRESMDRTQKDLAVAGETAKQKLSAAGEKISAATDKAVAQTKEAAREVKSTAYEPGPSSRANGDARPRADGATAPKESDTRATLGDAAITASIKTDFLKDPDLSVLKIDVDTRDGVVTLNGLAENDAARQRAEKMAAAVKGVREVRNYLTVKRG